MTKETLLKKSKTLQETVNLTTIGDIENFARKKAAQYLVWENKFNDYIIQYGLDTSLKITIEVDVQEGELSNG